MKVIKNGTLVYSDKTIQADIAFQNEKIIRIEKSIETEENDIVVDASGCFVFPGFIDGHTHLDMETSTSHTADNFETGTKAALVNGTTSIVDFATQNKGESLSDAYDAWMQKAKGNSSCDYRFHMAITDFNSQVNEEILKMPEKGITSFKMYMAYDNLYSNDAKILACLKTIKKINGVLGVHCENGKLVNALRDEVYNSGIHTPKGHPLSRPPEVEAEAINRFAYISKLADHQINIVHLSSRLGLEEVRKARKDGVNITVETCPQYLFLEDSRYDAEEFDGAKYVMSPPLRKVEDQEALIQAIVNKEIDTIATDHCSFNFKKDKELGKDDFREIPNGGPGIEHRGLLIYTNLVHTQKISVSDMCSLMCEQPAKRYGMFPKKGVLEVGSDADIVVFDPTFESVIQASRQIQNVDYTPYEGMHVFGKAKAVFLRGNYVVDDGKIIKTKIGNYIK